MSMVEAALSTESFLAESLRRVGWGAEHGAFDTGRYRCKYVTWGSGPPLVFLHGLADSLRSFAMPMALLSRDFRCIAYNQPTGLGDRARLGNYRHHDLVEDLFALMDHLGVREASVLGYSFGSTLALRAMHTRPERLRRGVLVGGFAHRPLARVERWLAWVARSWFGRVRLLPFRTKILRESHYGPFQAAGAEVWDFFLEHTGQFPIRAFAHWALELHRTDVRELVSAIRQPVLLICGDCDPLVSQACQDYLLQQLSNAVMFRVTSCGHFPMLTHPEAMVDAIRRFHHAAGCPLTKSGAMSICAETA